MEASGRVLPFEEGSPAQAAAGAEKGGAADLEQVVGLQQAAFDRLAVDLGARCGCRGRSPRSRGPPTRSSRHCRLERVADHGYEVIDLGSRTGTQVNGKPVKRCLLAPGDLLQIGRTTLFCAGRGLEGEPSSNGSTLPEASTFLSALLEPGRLPALAAARAAAPAHGLVGDSPALAKVTAMIAKAAPTSATVLILGESGTGKELAARAIHAASPRAAKSFVAINCASLSETLLESELFGHEKGAFTGAVEKKEGKIEVAAGGTLFLDEVGELPPAVQARLLRVLQERSFERVGGTKTLAADVRFLAATHRDLEQEAKAGRFREDLFYRLNVVAFKMPALRERPEDVPLLAAHFAARHGEALRGRAVPIAPAALAALRRHSWPGNVRELANAIERAIVLGSGEIGSKRTTCPRRFRPGRPPSGVSGGRHRLRRHADPGEPWEEAVGRFKKSLLRQVLADNGGNVTQAAAALGLHPNHLHRLLTGFDLR